MPRLYPRPYWVLPTALVLAPLGNVLAQAPVITSVIPMANARAAIRTSPVTVNFNQPLTAASAGALKVFSSQRGGLRTRGATPAMMSGNTLSFAPTAYPYMPGETVQYTVTSAAASSGGLLAQARVGQFTAAVNSSAGIFQGGSDPDGGTNPWWGALGDIDGDGDLDLLTANLTGPPATVGTVSVRFNDGTGRFSGTQEVPVGPGTMCVALGDIDGDGDLDFVSANYAVVNGSSSVSVRFNDGAGTFSGTQNLNIGGNSIASVALGDTDGDGDLDLFATICSGRVAVLLNNGAGNFSLIQNVLVTTCPQVVVLGDIDNDGDLDLLTGNSPGQDSTQGFVSVRLNDGTGLFSGNQEVSVGNNPSQIALGDVDGDGDLDIAAANTGNSTATSNTVSMRLNNGSGLFGGSQEVTVATSPGSIALGDADGDGDLDLFTANGTVGTAPSSTTVILRLNNGSGLFSGSQEVVVGVRPRSVVLGDVDNDGDLDIVTGNASWPSASVRLNAGTNLAASTGHPAAAFLLFPVPAHSAVTIIGALPNAPLNVLDSLGRTQLTATADASGTVQLVLPSGMPTGVYLVRSGGQVRRLVVE